MSSRMSSSDGDVAVLTFGGTAFAQHVLTREALKELDDFLALVAEVAEHFWLRDHPSAMHVPKEFDERTTPVMAGLLASSSGVLLKRPAQAFVFDQASPVGGEPDWIDQALDCLYRTISDSAVESELWALTPAILRGIERLGSRLPEGSHVGLETPDGPMAVLSDGVRQRLGDAADGLEEAEDGGDDGITILSRIFDRHFGDLPKEVWDEFPADLSEELDHYVHGAAKKSGEPAR